MKSNTKLKELVRKYGYEGISWMLVGLLRECNSKTISQQEIVQKMAMELQEALKEAV
jgi:hypothetical protein